MPYGRLAPDDVTDMLDYWNKRMRRWVGLVFGDPFLVNDPLSVEVLGDAYRRAPFIMTRVDKVLRNAGPFQWSVAPGSSLHGVASWDAAFNGHPCHYTPFNAPIDYPAGGTFILPAYELAIGLDS